MERKDLGYQTATSYAESQGTVKRYCHGHIRGTFERINSVANNWTGVNEEDERVESNTEINTSALAFSDMYFLAFS